MKFLNRPSLSREPLKEIKPAEVIVWSWASIGRSVVKFLLFGLFGGLLYGLFMGLPGYLLLVLLSGPTGDQPPTQPEWLFDWLVGGPFLGVVIGLFGGLVGGLSRQTLDEHNFVRPNQGIWRSARNSILVGLLFVALFVALSGLVGWPLGAPLGGLEFGVFFGVVFGLVGALLSGGIPCIQHLVLRLLLWQSGALPWHYVRFLEEATEHILLQRVGGGYRFIHPLFLGYFAALGAAASPGTVEQSFPEQQ